MTIKPFLMDKVIMTVPKTNINKQHTIMKKFLLAVVALFLSVSAFAELPSVQLKDINGKRVDTAKLDNDGKPYIISFFATWCKPCLRELDAVNEVYPDWQDETGMKLIAVSIDKAQDESKVKPLVNSKGYEYEVLLDPNGDFKRAMGVNMVPTVFIIDGNNNVVDTRTQYTDGSESHLIEKIRELIAKDSKKGKGKRK